MFGFSISPFILEIRTWAGFAKNKRKPPNTQGGPRVVDFCSKWTQNPTFWPHDGQEKIKTKNRWPQKKIKMVGLASKLNNEIPIFWKVARLGWPVAFVFISV